MTKKNKTSETGSTDARKHHGAAGGARRRALTLLVFVSLCLSLTACGGAGQETREGNASGAPAPKEPASGERAVSRETTTKQPRAEGAATGEGPANRTFALPGARTFPEGVAYDPATGDFFVGSTRSGAVLRGNVRDVSGETEVFLEGGADGRGGVTGMKVDGQGRLWISGRDSGRAFVYDAGSGKLIKVLDTPPAASTLINDVTVTQDAAYFTDSFRPTLFRVPLTAEGVGDIEPWLDFGGTPVRYQRGFNLNGIAATADGRYLITVQFNTGELYRIDTETGEIMEVDLGGETLKTGDGLLLESRTLYVVRESPGEIVPVRLSKDFASGEIGEPFSDASFRFPTTIAGYDDRLLVVNSQLNTGSPKLPFTVSDVPVPPGEEPRE